MHTDQSLEAQTQGTTFFYILKSLSDVGGGILIALSVQANETLGLKFRKRLGV